MPRPAYSRFVQALVENGFGKRIMFGSDFPNQAEAGIDAIMRADFLSAAQKADILCNNAERFLPIECGDMRFTLTAVAAAGGEPEKVGIPMERPQESRGAS